MGSVDSTGNEVDDLEEMVGVLGRRHMAGSAGWWLSGARSWKEEKLQQTRREWSESPPPRYPASTE